MKINNRILALNELEFYQEAKHGEMITEQWVLLASSYCFHHLKDSLPFLQTR